MTEIHQNVIIDGKDVGAPARVGSKVTNEGKWENFIEPLLPNGNVFVEYGSNAGMFLKLAQKKYERVIGIERERRDHEVALKYREDDDYKLINSNINNHDLFSIPLADVTLLANFHYHQHIDEFRRLLDKIEARTCYLVIVSVEEPNRHWRAQPHAKDILGYLKHWELVDSIPTFKIDNDPHPRPMFSMLFKSPKIERIPLKEIKIIGSMESDEYNFGREFIKDALVGKNLRTTKYYELKNSSRLHKWSHERIDSYMEGKYHLVKNIALEGLLEPLLLDRKGYLVDGLHRYFTLLELGNSAIVRRM